MDAHTHREHLGWLAWLDLQWNRPDRADHYQMQTACEVRRVLAKDPNSIQPKQFNIPFKTATTQTGSHPVPPLTKEQINKVKAAVAKHQRVAEVTAKAVSRE